MQRVKVCFECGVEQPITEFYVHKMMADGHLGKCKTCTKAYMSKRSAEGLTRRIDWTRYHSADGKRRQYTRAKSEEWAAKNPEKRKAHRKVQAAIKAGTLIRPQTCQVRGCPDRPDAHHDDYSKPLEVMWLCPSHHQRYHLEVNREADA